MSLIKYLKINGAGNDFILIDKLKNPEFEPSKKIISQLCDRKKGIGADGVLLINDSENYDFAMNYFNADGSGGTLCGNGARCAIKYAEVSNRMKGNETSFSSNDSQYHGELISDNIIKFFLNPPSDSKFDFKIEFLNQSVSVDFVDTGSPHVVINIKDVLIDPKNPSLGSYKISDFPVEEIGKEIRNLLDFFPEGANVNFISISDNRIYIRSYERGVENETLACGTGSVAAAIVLNKKYKFEPPISLMTKSGAELIVDFEYQNNTFNNLSLTGPVEINYEGEYLI